MGQSLEIIAAPSTEKSWMDSDLAEGPQLVQRQAKCIARSGVPWDLWASQAPICTVIHLLWFSRVSFFIKKNLHSNGAASGLAPCFHLAHFVLFHWPLFVPPRTTCSSECGTCPLKPTATTLLAALMQTEGASQGDFLRACSISKKLGFLPGTSCCPAPQLCAHGCALQHSGCLSSDSAGEVCDYSSFHQFS